MSDASPSTETTEAPRPPSISAQDGVQTRSWADIFALPPALRQLFQRFPLHTYAANSLPVRSPLHGPQHALYIFTTREAALAGGPSYNPSCLKWQTYLKICGIDFTTVSSNNHASPSGSLPFLLPCEAAKGPSKDAEARPVPSGKIRRWAEDCAGGPETSRGEVKEELYYALLDHGLRRAWLYLLYLDPRNAYVMTKLYIDPHSSNTFVKAVTASQLRSAAEEEIRKSTPVTTMTPKELEEEGRDALVAVSELLNEQTWFFGREEPGLFDAAVFAYTHLLLDQQGMGWSAPPFEDVFGGSAANLVAHRERLLKMYYV